MKTGSWIVVAAVAFSSTAQAQDGEYAAAFSGPASVGSQEPLFRYDDQERWKHGYIMNMPYYGGYHYFRPYNYHHVFSQSASAAGWGMSPVMPYSQQFWHRYEAMVDLSRGQHTPVLPYEKPIKEFDHYPKPLNPQYPAPMAPNGPNGLQGPNGVVPTPAPTEYLSPTALTPTGLSSAQADAAVPALVVPPAPLQLPQRL